MRTLVRAALVIAALTAAPLALAVVPPSGLAGEDRHIPEIRHTPAEAQCPARTGTLAGGLDINGVKALLAETAQHRRTVLALNFARDAFAVVAERRILEFGHA